MFKSIAPINPINSKKVLRKIKEDLIRLSPLLLQLEQMAEEDLDQLEISSQLNQFHDAIMDIEAVISSKQDYGSAEFIDDFCSPIAIIGGGQSVSLRSYIQKEAKRTRRLSGQLQNSMQNLQQRIQDMQAQYPYDSNEIEQELQEFFLDQNIAY
jgi:hypothetical protein